MEEKKNETERIKRESPLLARAVCQRCHQSFRITGNTHSACRFHTSIFVCRRHDDQTRYYELGPNDPPYAAKFYDCCGAENPDAPGCTASFHLSYDDKE